MLLMKNNKLNKDMIIQLYDIITTISCSKDMRVLLEVTLNKTLNALSSERGSIFLAGDDGQELFLKSSHNNKPMTKDIKAKLGEGIIGRVAKDRTPLLVKDIRNDDRFTISSMYSDYKTNSFLCIPIFTDMKLIGVINITDNENKKPYTEKDLKFVKIVADHIALKIEKSYLLSDIDGLRKKVEEDNKFADLGKFSSGISHELNNPLDGVIRFVNLALESLGESPAKEYLMEAKGGLKRITNIIKSLLELARSKKVSNVAYVDLNTVIKNSLKLINYRASCKKVEIKKNLSKNVPRVPDYGLESVFSNLFINALDSLEEKGAITITASYKDKCIEICVTDTGCGIVKDNMEKIFEPFFTTKDITKGSGLGLSICYDIVKRYNGRINVFSEPGKGSNFIINIPCEK